MMHRLSGIAAAGLIAWAVSGCAQHHDVTAWQHSAQQYVAEQANDDLAALADVQQRSGHRLFKILGHERPDQGADAVGVFVGQRTLDDQPWMFFLVGQIEQRELHDARLVGVTQQGPELHWAVGPTDEQATQAYRRHQHELHGDRPPYAGWPDEGDAFRLEGEGPRLTVTEQRSGAAWSLNMHEHRLEGPLGSAVHPAAKGRGGPYYP